MEKVEPVSTGAPSLRVDQVLETATRLFTERGYDAASIRDLAAALAMRPSSLYHHFQGKQHILFAICFGMQTDFNAAVMPLFHQGKGPVETIQDVIRDHIRFSLARRGEVLVNTRERRSLPPHLLAQVNSLRRAYRDALVAVIEQGRRQGLFAVDDPKLAAMAVFDMVNGMFQWFQARDQADIERIGRLIAWLGRLYSDERSLGSRGQGLEQPTLDVADLTVRFGGVLALDHVSLRAEANEIHGIIGPNGAGKTTLFNAVCGFVRPERGTIRYRGEALLGTAPHQLAKLGIARTLQGVGLWPGLTVLENVLVGSRVRPNFVASLLAMPRADRLERRLRDEAIQVLEELGIASVAETRPGALPYGVQKRVIIARALMADPDLLLLDEPASGLSAGDIERLAELVGRLRQRMSVVVVEHHVDLVMAISQRITVLNFGAVIASGTPDEIRGNRQVSAAYLGEDVKTAEGGASA